MVSHDDIAELLGAYALDAVDPQERRLVAEHLVGCSRCAAEVDAHRRTAALLAHQGSDAPADVWDRISAELGARPGPVAAPTLPPGLRAAPGTEGPLSPGPAGGAWPPSEPAPVPGGATRRRWARRLVPAVAAVAAAAIAVLAFEVVRLDGSGATQGTPAVATLAAAAAADPHAQHVELAATSSPRRTEGELVILPDGTAYLLGGRLPSLPADRTYQLWGVAGGRTVSLGLLGRHPTVAVFHVSTAATTTFAVTAEPAGGVVVATTTPVATGSAA